MILFLAMLTMFIDHVGVVFFPETEVFRVIGRIAFPLYAFGIVQGYKHTSNLKRYMKRLFILAMVSQVPYFFLFQFQQLNVIFLFLIGLGSIYLLDNYKKSLSIPMVVLIGLMIQPFIEYGLYGLALVMIYKYLDGYQILRAHAVLSIVFWLIYPGFGDIQAFSLVATFILIHKDKLLKLPFKINRTFYRSFYPAHLAVLLMVVLLFK